MTTSRRRTLGQTGVALRSMIVATVLLGALYPLVVTGIAQTAFPSRADGSLVRHDGDVVGSTLIGQGFLDAEGEPLPQWFQSRPSAAGDGWDGGASSGSNLGPNNDDLGDAIEQRRATARELDGAAVPPDALTASGSGLDPHISPEYALLQVPRVADARRLDESDVRRLVESRIAGRDLGYLGEPTVNVLELNLALEGMDPDGR
ncbi:K+-transporting ATPase ATPase C chain [Diaminobutyricimonas aerilata]|uniref:Potassium-transporting ATPase KdpC subunit n=1 Tax=Diaminobutyricimonas aerilata TaxID=1162967 RepID=A0A2M9CJM5_9MICO|nr:potassium-transporting ATPase subunit KdpC [Diaminobutyricimonas aerilata]PJJ72102.1 K+-transporting ATPase ATPase C chain [Diaminobutyricimonas aerilata]